MSTPPNLAFYVTASALLGALLLTWLVSEAREIREARSAELAGNPESGVQRLPSGVIVGISLGLAFGLCIALRALFRGGASGWDAAVVWGALALGLVSVTASVVVGLRGLSVAPARGRWVRIARTWGALGTAVAIGFVASPVLLGPSKQVVGARFAVVGTCLSGGCGLKKRTGPGPKFPEVRRSDRLSDGEFVLIECQTLGTAARGYTTPVWNRLTDGTYVSDAFVNTPNRSGGFSEELPRCTTG